MEVQKRQEEFQRLSVTVLIITPSTTESVRSVKLPFEVLCDPERVAYRYFGLERGGVWMFFNARVLWHYFRMIFSGLLPRKPESGEDLFQLGGDFVLSVEHRLLFAYRSHDPADRPTIDDVIQTISKD